jgi:hypothetical protein
MEIRSTEGMRRARRAAAGLPPSLLLLLAGLAPGPAPGADGDDTVEYALKAAFLVNITKFVEWPSEAFPTADSPLVIAVLGKDPFGKLLDAAAEGRTVNNRKIAIRRLESAASPEPCHILFIADSEKDRRAAIQVAFKGKTVLMVSEFPDFAEKEGIIQFEKQDRKVRLVVNVDNAKDRSLKISANLLRIARIIRKSDSAS